MSLVVCKLPKAGLGNQLFPLMRAHVFAHLNNLPTIVTGYHQIKIGPYLRGEKSKRNYNGYFNFQKNFFGELSDKWKLNKNKNLQLCPEHSLNKIADDKIAGSKIYFYSEIPHWKDYFGDLKNYRELVADIFYSLISQNIKKKISLQKAPCIGVHIRMGDFRKLKEGEDFRKVGLVRTPENYFVDVINNIRQVHGTKLPVSVFSDGKKKELKSIFEMENVSLLEGNPDIVDLILLSKSKIIITSAASTFSYWAGFLSDAPIILHPGHINTRIRPDKNLYEGNMDSQNETLINYIRSI
jgi:glycosyl transferase family 11